MGSRARSIAVCNVSLSPPPAEDKSPVNEGEFIDMPKEEGAERARISGAITSYLQSGGNLDRGSFVCLSAWKDRVLSGRIFLEIPNMRQ